MTRDGPVALGWRAAGGGVDHAAPTVRLGAGSGISRTQVRIVRGGADAVAAFLPPHHRSLDAAGADLLSIVNDSLSIPPELDRALALAVLDYLRQPTSADASAGGSDDRALPAQLDDVLRRTVDELRARGAGRAEVTDALEDAFAALLAGQDLPEHRERVRRVDAHARSTVSELLAQPA